MAGLIQTIRGLDRLAVANFLAATLASAALPPWLIKQGYVATPQQAIAFVLPVAGFVYAWSVMRMLGDPKERSRFLVVVIFLVLWCFGVFVADFVSRFTLRRKPDFSHLEQRLKEREGKAGPRSEN